MKKVFVVNGYPRSGKDTFAEILGKYVKVRKISSVDEVKKVARFAGWNGVKDERGRRLLADLKRVLVEYDDLPLKYVLKEYSKFIMSDCDVLLVDIREHEEIVKFLQETEAKTIFIENKNIVNMSSNRADSNVCNHDYDYVICNNGTLTDFESNIREWLESIRCLN